MNVLCIYPGMSKHVNDNAFMLISLQERGVKLAVITSRSLGLKGVGKLAPYEDMDGVPVYRLYNKPLDIVLFPRRKLKEILKVAKQLRPDLIFCSQELNMRLASLLREYLKIPIALLVEDAGRIFSGEAYRRFGLNTSIMKVLGIPTGPKTWQWLCKEASALITCHPRDPKMIGKLSQYSKPVSYIPWPTHIPGDFEPPSLRKRHRAIYVGSLYPFKNTQEFEWVLPRIVKETCTKEFIVVGPGPHAKMVKQLQRKTHDAIRHIRQLPRKEALRLIATSYYGYTPVVRGGWGFIGDCWGMGTPVIMTHNDDYVTDNVNALVAKNEDNLIQKINFLYREPELFKALQRRGYEESKMRRAEVVSSELHAVFTKALSN